MTTLHELAAMLDAATGPSREMDFSIHTAATGLWRTDDFPAYTSSIDAALALAERMLPDSWVRIERITLTRWQVRFEGGEIVHWAKAPTAPLAILKALVAALIAQEKTNE